MLPFILHKVGALTNPSPALLKEIQLFCANVRVFQLLSHHIITNNKLQLRNWVPAILKNFTTRTPKLVKTSTHLLSHWEFFLSSYGPGRDHWVFVHERLNGDMKKYFKNTNHKNVSFFVLKRYFAFIFTLLSSQIDDSHQGRISEVNHQWFLKPNEPSVNLPHFLETSIENITLVDIFFDKPLASIECIAERAVMSFEEFKVGDFAVIHHTIEGNFEENVGKICCFIATQSPFIFYLVYERMRVKKIKKIEILDWWEVEENHKTEEYFIVDPKECLKKRIRLYRLNESTTVCTDVEYL